MPGKTAEHRKLVALKAVTSRHHPGRDTTELDREIRTLTLAEHIRNQVDAFPPLTDEQRARLAAILSPAGA